MKIIQKKWILIFQCLFITFLDIIGVFISQGTSNFAPIQNVNYQLYFLPICHYEYYAYKEG